MANSNSQNVLENLFAGDGEMFHLMRSHDWSQTPLGSVEQWPQSLRTTVSILLNSRYPMFTFWGSHLVKLYNDAYRPILGSTKHPSALGRPAPEVWPDIWDDIGPLVEQAIAKGEATWFDNFLLFMNRSGYLEETYFTFSYSPIRDETGGIGGLFCACTETTKQVLGERRLRTLRDLAAQSGKTKTAEEACESAMKTLANNPADLPFALLYLLDADGKRADLAGTTGLESNTPASPNFIELAEPSQSPTWPLAKVVDTARIERVDNALARLGGLKVGTWEESPQTALVVPVTSPGQERPAGLLVAGISSRRALDDDYQGFLELVAGQVATAIASARAYEAERKRAEALAEIDRAKTIFFSNVSHEFRTPLTLMLAPVEDALADKETPLQPRQRARLEIVRGNGLRLLKLVNTLLDFSRLEAGRVQAVYEPTDLATLTADLASMFRSPIERADMSLVVDCPPLPEAIYVDREMWEKIVLNLLSNAFKFTLAGTISVRLQSFENCVELTVEDTGIGISPDEITHLFERFHRVKGAQGRSFEGSGIGLSLVQELVKLHGGTVRVTSESGKGSCFIVSIPTGFTHLPSERIDASPTLSSTATKATLYVEETWRWLSKVSDGENREVYLSPSSASFSSSARILLADDNADMRNYVKRLLEQRYEVEAVEDGEAALAAIRQRIPDLILTDVMMPQLDGFGLLQALRAEPQTRELPIILLSARAGEESRIEGLAAGADDYLIKPFSSQELLARVEASLQMAQLRREATVREQALRLTAEKAQQEAEAISERLIHILESMSDSFVSLDKDWRITYQNAAAEQINKKPRTEVIGKTNWEEWPASVGTNIEYQYRRAVAEQVAVHFEHHYYAPPNYDVWLEIHAYPSKDGLAIFYRDVTERKQAEEALRQSKEALEIRVLERTAELNRSNVELQQSESTLRSFFNSGTMQMGIIELHDNDILYISVNQATAKFLGTTPETIQNRFVSEMGVTQEAIEHWISYYRQAEQTQAPVNFEYLYDDSNGQRWLSATVCPIAISSSGCSRFSYIVEDITERKRSEEQIAASLTEKEVMLKEIHHRVKNNLQVICSLLNLQARSLKDSTTTALFKETQNRVRSMALVHEKLYQSNNLSKIELREYLQDLANNLFRSYSISSSKITLTTQLNDSICLDIDVAVPCGLMVNELLSNALKHAFKPEEKGEIFLQSLIDKKQNIILTIRDNGQGLPHGFDVEKTSTLGLKLVKNLINQLRGQLELESSSGTKFQITLPQKNDR